MSYLKFLTQNNQHEAVLQVYKVYNPTSVSESNPVTRKPSSPAVLLITHKFLLMESVFIFLSAFVAISQQFHQQLGHDWLTSHYPPQRIINNRPPIYYDYLRDIPAFRQFVPTNPHPAHENELYPSFIAMDLKNSQEFLDVQSRIKGLNGRRPLVHQQMPGSRFFFNNAANIYSNRFTKTATFTVTSSVTLTTVQSCVAAINVFDTGKCRKRNILDNLDDIENVEYEYDIDPSEANGVIIPTNLPSLDLMLDDYTFSDDAIPSDNVGHNYTINGDTTSSSSLNQDSVSEVVRPIQEVIVEVPTSTSSWWTNLKGKLLFSYSLTSTTVTSYSFFSTTVTKTVAIAGEAEIKCIPLDWVVCF